MRTREKFVVPSRRRLIDFCFFFSNGFPTSGDVYYVGKPIESVTLITQTSIFHGFIGAINGRFLTNRGARSILTIL